MVAVKVGVLVGNAHLRVVTPSAIRSGNLVCQVVFDQPIERTVQRYTVNIETLLLGDLLDFLVRERGSGGE